jgi:hypothetical protein
MSGDWLKLHRVILDSEVMTDSFLCHLWVWCLCRANYHETVFRGQAVKVGQFVTGTVRAAEALRVSRSKLLRGLRRLKEMGNIALETNNHWTTITICRWQTYQNSRPPACATNGQPVGNHCTTAAQPVDTSKEGKNLGGKPPKNPPTLPGELDTPEFHAAWERWLTHRKEIRHPLRPTTQASQLKKLAAWGAARAVAALEQSITNGWQGIFEPRDESRAGESIDDFLADYHWREGEQ